MSPPTLDDDPSLGKVFLGKYRIVQRLARGGMGTIYLARNEGAAGFVKPVVVKRILPGSVDAIALRMFEREARIMSHLRHPGIVDVIDFSAEDDGYLMVLDYVHGYHLGKWYRWVQKIRGAFVADVAVYVMANVLDALHYAHTLTDADGNALRVIHRDIKPSNIMVDVDGHVKLLDFGIAQMVTDRTEQTDSTSVVKGTFAYLAPELLRSGGEPTPLSDVYACGVVLHEILAGRNEFRQPDLAMTAARVLRHQPTPLAELRPDVSPALSAVVAEAMAKDPARRYPSAQEFARALRSTRRVAAENVAEQTVRGVQADFRDPDFTIALGVEPLDALERAWKNPPTALLKSPAAQTKRTPGAEIAGPEDETKASPPPIGAVVPRRGLPGWALLGILIAVGGVAGAAAVVQLNKPPKAPPQVVVLRGDVQPTGDTEFVQPPPAPASAPPAPPAVTPPVPPATPRPRRLEDPFREHIWDIETRCLQAHAEQAKALTRLEVKFTVDPSGHVQRAEVSPASAEGSPLGDCVLAYARKTRFDHRLVQANLQPGQPHLVFTVPIEVRAQK